MQIQELNNERTGQITTANTTINKGTTAAFTVNNSYITSAKDMVIVNIASGASVNYSVSVNSVNAAGSFVIVIDNCDGTPPGSNAADTLVINFAVIKVS
jgi:sporulation protein YlmC with PRC-barrel domain